MRLLLGDSKEVLKDIPDNSIDSIVTDPPYGLTFMGKAWDGTGIEYDHEFWGEILRILKPGGHVLSFGGTRTYHRMATALEIAGFEIRDCIMWLNGQGMPKSFDLGTQATKRGYPEAPTMVGWGTTLKPAVEPVVLARKPFSEKSVIENFIKWGTGALNIDETRIDLDGEVVSMNRLVGWSGFGQQIRPDYTPSVNDKGRYPAHLLLDEEAAEILDKDVGQNVSRFFYCSKASKKEKDAGLDDMPVVAAGALSGRHDGSLGGITMARNVHPTIKPIDLMRYLCKLITPKGGIVLDPFMGTGTTGIACGLDGFEFVGVEKEQESYDVAVKRIRHWTGKESE